MTVAIPKFRAHPQLALNRRQYAERHNVALLNKFEYPPELVSERLAPHWAKVYYLSKALPEYDWVLLADSDVLITALGRSLYDMVKEAGDGVHAIFPRELAPKGSRSGNGGTGQCAFSNYAMLVRNSEVGRRFVDMWWADRKNKCGWYDQCPCWRAIVRLLRQQRGEANYSLPVWKNEDAALAGFDKEMAALSGDGGSCRAGDHDDKRTMGPLLFTTALGVQLKLHLTAHCPIKHFERTYERVFCVHAGRMLYPGRAVSLHDTCTYENKTLCECTPTPRTSCFPTGLFNAFCDADMSVRNKREFSP